MSKDDSNVYEAKKSLKAHIKFMEVLIQHLNGNDQVLKGRAMFASWCLHRYFQDRLVPDIQQAIAENSQGASNDDGKQQQV